MVHHHQDAVAALLHVQPPVVLDVHHRVEVVAQVAVPEAVAEVAPADVLAHAEAVAAVAVLRHVPAAAKKVARLHARENVEDHLVVEFALTFVIEVSVMEVVKVRVKPPAKVPVFIHVI